MATSRLRWGLPFLSAIMFWASFHPVNIGILGFLCLVPLLIFAQVTSGKKAFFAAWGGGYVAFALGYSWFGYTVPVGPWLVAIYMGLYFPLFVFLVRKLGVAWSPVAWLATEVLRSTFFGGLPWLLLGYTQHDLLYFIQIADLGGIWLVSLVVAFVNMAIVHPRKSVKAAAAAVILVSVLYGAIRVETMKLFDGPEIAVVQPNIPQSLKNRWDEDELVERNYQKHLELTTKAAAGKPDLIVWPEAAIYRGIILDTAGENAGWRKTSWYYRLIDPAKETNIQMVIGLLILERAGEMRQYSNSAVRVLPDEGIAGRYDKMHLVPFAETFGLPIFREAVRIFSGLNLVNMKAGDSIPVWDLKGRKYGAQICYEAIFPEISRESARKGAGFTVNISNDGWFESSGELDQMLVMARFRSIENRIHVIRATNTGISAFIEPTGRVQAILEVDGKCKEVGGVLSGRIRMTEATSLFRMTGEWVAWVTLGAAAVELVRRILIDRKKKSA